MNLLKRIGGSLRWYLFLRPRAILLKKRIAWWGRRNFFDPPPPEVYERMREVQRLVDFYRLDGETLGFLETEVSLIMDGKHAARR